MYADISKPPASLPSAAIQVQRPGMSLQPPLTRRGTGPGLIILATAEEYDEQVRLRDDAPTAVLKWAEEGYSVVQISATAVEEGHVEEAFTGALEALDKLDACQPKDKVGLVCYSSSLWNTAAPALKQFPRIVAAIVYVDDRNQSGLSPTIIPSIRHVAGPAEQSGAKGDATAKNHYYPQAKGQRWFSAGHSEFDYLVDSLAHTRNLQFLKPKMGGPFFDLEDIWEEHTYYEFADRSVAHTMSTMVQEPYVNHVPTITGGIGRLKLTEFYRQHFIFNNSADTALELISRTVGIDRVIDEFIFKFTHDQVIDWLLPGVPPTFRKAEVPFVAIVNFRGDRLYHEHISWDQGTTLRQLGLLPEYLPFPYPLAAGGTAISDGAEVEYRVPVQGIETADKMRNRRAVPSNAMFEYAVRERKN